MDFRWIEEHLDNNDIEFLCQKVRVVKYHYAWDKEFTERSKKEVHSDEMKTRNHCHHEYSKYKAGNKVDVCKHACGRMKKHVGAKNDGKKQQAMILFRYYVMNNGFRNHSLRIQLNNGRKYSIPLM